MKKILIAPFLMLFLLISTLYPAAAAAAGGAVAEETRYLVAELAFSVQSVSVKFLKRDGRVRTIVTYSGLEVQSLFKGKEEAILEQNSPPIHLTHKEISEQMNKCFDKHKMLFLGNILAAIGTNAPLRIHATLNGILARPIKDKALWSTLLSPGLSTGPRKVTLFWEVIITIKPLEAIPEESDSSGENDDTHESPEGAAGE